MPRQTKSQWEFGELFEPAATRHVLTVSELTATVRRLLEKEVGQVWVSGEITNLRLQASGHMYFTLKDRQAQLACVLFRDEARSTRHLLQDGVHVTLRGTLTVYEPRGQYQLRVTEVELEGIGALQVAFEKLKRKLDAEGLFAPERKRPLPTYPRRIGLVTSPTGAAIRDVLHVIQRRQPFLEIVLVPSRVQGAGAAAEIASAIRFLNEWAVQESLPPGPHAGQTPWLDLILVTRGGGSLEDLWAFNEEVVARAIFDSTLPVVSAVGHEIDFTISDFVADVRAATPSAAAELITAGPFGSRRFLEDSGTYLVQLVRQRLEDEWEELDKLGQRLARAHPQRRLDEKWQLLDDLQNSLCRCTRLCLRHHSGAWENLAGRLSRVKPSLLVSQRRLELVDLSRRLRDLARQNWRNRSAALEQAESRLRLLSPMHVLERGYSITVDAASGKVVRKPDDVEPGRHLKTRVKTGEIRSVVEPNA